MLNFNFKTILILLNNNIPLLNLLNKIFLNRILKINK